MSETTLGRAKIPIEGDLAKLDKDLSSARSKVSSAVDGIVANVQKVGSAALAGVGIVSGVAAGAATALGKLAIDAAPVEGLQKAFEGLATSSGKSMDEMLGALQRGSSGMISQRDLMQTYNKAGQLVSVTFANQLPDAMDYLSKVSASTGQDMGFMLDSLVTGVGRLSPMILDNLGIQVSLSEATERAARSFGVEASALDKTQIQAGMMEVVLEKLAANTAAMPDVSASAAAGLARMGATVQDTKDALGLALQPALTGVMDGVGALAEKFLPVLIDFFEQKVAPVVTKIAEFFQTFATSLAEGASPADALKLALEAIGLEDVAVKIEEVVAKVLDFRDSLQELWDKVTDFLKPITDFIAENVILQDVLIALAAIILATVVPAVVSWVASMGPILLTVAAVIAVVALLRKLCEDDFALLKQAWAAVGQAFEDVGLWIGETVTDIGNWLSKTWNDIKTSAANAWSSITNGIKDKIEEIKNKIKDEWSEIRFWLEDTGERIRDNLRDAWERARQYVVDKVQAMIDRVRDLWSDMKDAGGRLVQGLKDGINNAWNSFLSWLRGILDQAVDSVKSFFGIHSPSALFAGIGENLMSGLAEGIGDGVTVPVTTMMNASQDLAELAMGTTVELRGGQGQPAAGVTIYGGLALYGVQDARGLLGELQALV